MTRYDQIANTLSPAARRALVNTRGRMYSPLPQGTPAAVQDELTEHELITAEGRINDFGLGVRGVTVEQEMSF